MMNKYGQVKDIYGFQTLFREIGYNLSRLEQYEKSLKYYDEALKKTPDDKRALIGRSRARAKLNQYEGALEDINKALKLDPEDLVVLADMCHNTYLCCEFEEGLIENLRLIPKRQKPENFHMGVMQCSDAIENCIGERTGRPLRNHFKIIRNLAWKKNYAAQKPFQPTPNKKSKSKKTYLAKLEELRVETQEPVQPKKLKALKNKSKDVMSSEIALALQIRDSLVSASPDDNFVPDYSTDYPSKPLQNYSSNIENYMAEKYLDSMYLDKIFLKKLQSEPGAQCPNVEGSKKIKQLSKRGFKSVSYKQELLRTRRPFYFIKNQEATVSEALKARQSLELQKQREIAKIEAEAIKDKMIDAYDRKQLKELLEVVKKLKRFCDNTSKKLLPDKNEYVSHIYEVVCKAWYDLFSLKPEQSEFEQKRRIYSLFEIPVSREQSTDSLIGPIKNLFINYKREISILEKAVEEAVSHEEICWYYFDLARYYHERKKYDLARAYARKCIHEATMIDNQKWIFNCNMIMIKSNLAENNKNDAKTDIAKARRCVKKLEDEEKLDYLNKCLEVIESVAFEDSYGTRQLERRETKIIQMMSTSKMRDEVAHLFREMAAMPTTRRMVVIPGVRAESKKGKKGIRKSAVKQDSNPVLSSSKPPATISEKHNMRDLIGFHG